MIKSRIAVASALLAVASAANAGFTLTPALTTDYDFRGISQNDESETLQLGLNYSLESGVYIGAWASEVDFGPASDAVWELDLMAGYAWGDTNEGVGYDVGAIMYSYPSASSVRDIYEIYGGISHRGFSGKVWVAPDNYDEMSIYAEANYTLPLPKGFSAGFHAGYSFGDYWSGAEYVDYSVGLSKKLSKLDLNLKYVNSNDYKSVTVGRNAWIFTVSTTLPW